MTSVGSILAPVTGPIADAVRGTGDAIRRRLELLRGEAPPDAHAPPLHLFAAEFGQLFAPAFRLFKPPLPIDEAENPRVIILLPGFAANPQSMKRMARELERAGHTVKRWGLGSNYGPTPENFEQLAQRVCSVNERYGQDVVLVGWSLGGIFAREVAKMHPDCVAKVITMGTPFSHTPYSNNVWRIYQAWWDTMSRSRRSKWTWRKSRRSRQWHSGARAMARSLAAAPAAVPASVTARWPFAALTWGFATPARRSLR